MAAPAAGSPKKAAPRKTAAKKAPAKAAPQKVELPPELTVDDREWVDDQLAVGDEAPGRVDETDPMIAEVEAEESVGDEPEGIPPGSIEMFIRRKAEDPKKPDVVTSLWACPVTMWPSSAFRYLDAMLYYRWADIVLIPESLEDFNDLDPTIAECSRMVAEWNAAAAVELGKLRTSARSSRSTRRR